MLLIDLLQAWSVSREFSNLALPQRRSLSTLMESSLEVARAKALDGIRDFLSAELRNGTLDLRGRVDIEDEVGAVLITIPFAEAVAIKAA